jgi:hypothetical protein
MEGSTSLRSPSSWEFSLPCGTNSGGNYGHLEEPPPLWAPAFELGIALHLILDNLRIPPGRALTSRRENHPHNPQNSRAQREGVSHGRFPHISPSSHTGRPASGPGDHILNILTTPLARSLKGPRSGPDQVRLGAGDLDRGPVEAAEDEATTGKLVGILTGPPGNGANWVAVASGDGRVEKGTHTHRDRGTPAAKAANRGKRGQLGRPTGRRESPP